jgi:hypothetical protein
MAREINKFETGDYSKSGLGPVATEIKNNVAQFGSSDLTGPPFRDGMSAS